MSLGGAEILVIFVIAVALFGPALIAFWLGYTLGKRKTAEEPTPQPTEVPAPPPAEQIAVVETPEEGQPDE